MKKLILINDTGIVTNSSGTIWKVTPDNKRQRVYDGELLKSGTILELAKDADIQVEAVANTPAPLFRSNLPVEDVVEDNDGNRDTSRDQPLPIASPDKSHRISESLATPEIIPLFANTVSPESGFLSRWQTRFTTGNEEINGSNDQGNMDVLAIIIINTPVTSDNIVNNQESQSLTVSGTVFNVEAFRPVVVTLTDSAGHQFQQETTVNADSIHWETVFNELQQKGLVDGDIRISAATSDLSGNMATDTTWFLLDTITEVTIGLVRESNSCFGHPGYYPGNPTNVNNPVITGTGEPGATITLLIDGKPEIDGIKVDSSGHWSARVSGPLNDGIYTLRAETTDIPGNTSSAEFTLTIDATATIWINDVNTYASPDDGLQITGETTGVQNNQLVNIDIRSNAPVPINPPQAPVIDGQWVSPPLPPGRNGIMILVDASVEDQACSIARDQMVPLGNPLDLRINEGNEIGVNNQFDPQGNASTVLSFDNTHLNPHLGDLPANLSAIDGGITFALTWKIINPRTLSAVYQDGTETQTAFSVTLPDNGIDTAAAVLFKPLLHPTGTDTAITFTVPYLKSLYSPTYQKNHYSIAGLKVSILDDAPTLSDHTPVQLAEGTTAQWENNNGKLFTPEQAGVDGGQLSSINGIPLDAGNRVSAGTFSGYYQFPVKYGTLFVTRDGAWSYQAQSGLMHTADTPLTETCAFKVTDTDGDSDSAEITFNVVDGTPLSFSSSSASAMTIDQECDQPGPMPDQEGVVEVIKGSDPLLPDKLQFDLDATLTAINQSMNGLYLSSEGVALDLENLYPGVNNQAITLSTVLGKPVISISLQDITPESTGNLTAMLEVLQKASLDVSPTEPATIPVILNASDQDINTVSLRVTLAMIDGGITLNDDYITVTEGQTVTGNLLENDLHCLDPIAITRVTLDDVDLIYAHIGQSQSLSFLPNTTIPTPYGTLTVQSNGDYSLTARSGLYNATPTPLQFTYTATDSTGDSATALVIVAINDGEAPSGGERVELSFTENNLEISPRYPVYQAGPVTQLIADGSDPIDTDTLTFTINPAELGWPGSDSGQCHCH